jgi:hypothetical protein
VRPDKAHTLANIRAFPLLPQAGACLASLAKRYFARMRHRRPNRFFKTFLSAVAGATLLFGSNIASHAAEPDAFYKGKTVFSISASPRAAATIISAVSSRGTLVSIFPATPR